MQMLGHALVWQAENDPNCCKILEQRFPGAPNLGDIKVIDWSLVEPVDMLIAGPPCQPISMAGNRRGEKDERWLWPFVFDAVRQLRPRVCFFENPTGFLAPIEWPKGSGRWWRPPIEGVMGEMAALGLHVEWGVLSASAVGAAHRRDRVFILATNLDRESLREQPITLLGGRGKTFGGLVASDVSRERRKIRPQPNGEAEEFSVEASRRPDIDGHSALADIGKSRRETTSRDGIPEGVPSERTQFPWGKYEAAIRRHEAIWGPSPWPLTEGGAMNPDWSDWYMGFEPGWTDCGVARTRRVSACGNAVVPLVGAVAFTLLSERFAE